MCMSVSNPLSQTPKLYKFTVKYENILEEITHLFDFDFEFYISVNTKAIVRTSGFLIYSTKSNTINNTFTASITERIQPIEISNKWRKTCHRHFLHRDIILPPPFDLQIVKKIESIRRQKCKKEKGFEMRRFAPTLTKHNKELFCLVSRPAHRIGPTSQLASCAIHNLRTLSQNNHAYFFLFYCWRFFFVFTKQLC